MRQYTHTSSQRMHVCNHVDTIINSLHIITPPLARFVLSLHDCTAPSQLSSAQLRSSEQRHRERLLLLMLLLIEVVFICRYVLAILLLLNSRIRIRFIFSSSSSFFLLRSPLRSAPPFIHSIQSRDGMCVMLSTRQDMEETMSPRLRLRLLWRIVR